MSTQNQLNLAEKSNIELKAIAFDLKTVMENYGQLYNLVTAELQKRSQQEQQAAIAEAKTPDAEPFPEPAPKKQSKLKKV